MKHALACLAAISLSISSASVARADDDDNHNVIVEPPQYVAPLSQQTQPSYIPQSVALSGPRVIDEWNESRPMPQGYHAESRTRTGMVVAGASVFGTLYGLSLLAAQDNDNVALAVPVFGPLLQLAGNHNDDATALLAIDALGQAAGAVMLIVGLTTHKMVLVRNDLAEVHIAPMVTKEGAGAGLVGRF